MKIFISYRRDDSAGHAGRVHDRLAHEFGRDLLFMDVDAIPLGENFIKILRQQVARCDVLLAMIGPDWLSAQDDEGNRRLNNAHDFVRIEIATALGREIPVIPILLEGAKVPRADQLPRDLKELAVRNGLDVRHASFHSDMDRLVQSLKARETPRPPSGRQGRQEFEAPLGADTAFPPRHDEEDWGLREIEARKAFEAETRRKLEAETRQKLEAEARQRLEEETRLKLEAETRRKLEEETRQRIEAETRRKLEEETRQRIEAETRQKMEAETRQRLEAEAQQKLDAEARQKAEAEARQKAEAEARQKRPPPIIPSVPVWRRPINLIAGGLAAVACVGVLAVWGFYKSAAPPVIPSPSPPAIPSAPPIAAVPTVACSGDKVLLDEDFSHADASWGKQNSVFSISNGSAYIKPDNRDLYSYLDNGFLFNDADICLTVSPMGQSNPQQQSHPEAGLVFWALNNDNFFLFEVGADGQYKVSRLVKNAWVHSALDWQPSDAIVQGTGKSNQLRLTIQGQILTLGINGKTVTKLQAQAPGAPSFIGLAAQGQSWKFNTLKVTNVK